MTTPTTHDDVALCEGCNGPLNAEGDDSIVSDGDGRKYCCDGCMEDALESANASRADDMERGDYDDLIDGVGFADPGGNSALRAATASNPRNLPCPSCKQPNRLTPADRRAGYQCDRCADRAEGYGAFADY